MKLCTYLIAMYVSIHAYHAIIPIVEIFGKTLTQIYINFDDPLTNCQILPSNLQ